MSLATDTGVLFVGDTEAFSSEDNSIIFLLVADLLRVFSSFFLEPDKKNLNNLFTDANS